MPVVINRVADSTVVVIGPPSHLQYTTRSSHKSNQLANVSNKQAQHFLLHQNASSRTSLFTQTNISFCAGLKAAVHTQAKMQVSYRY